MSDAQKFKKSDLNKETTTAQIKSAVKLAWQFVAVGFGLAGLGIAKVLFEGGFTLSNLSSLGSYLQGAVGSIWALAGLLFIYAAFQAQRQQLHEQDKELEKKEAQYKKQNFETTFFQMLNLYNQIVSDLSYTEVMLDPQLHGGRNCFKFWYEHFKKGDWLTISAKGYEKVKEKFDGDWYGEFYKHFQGSLGHYFRTLYHLIKYVEAIS